MQTRGKFIILISICKLEAAPYFPLGGLPPLRYAQLVEA